MTFQTYVKDCDCKSPGIIVYENKLCCRWCRKPYAEGGLIDYKPEHFAWDMTDADKLRKLADWFDMYDATRTFKVAGNEVQSDLRRIAKNLESYDKVIERLKEYEWMYKSLQK